MANKKTNVYEELKFIDERLAHKKILNLKMIYGRWFMVNQEIIRKALDEYQSKETSKE